MKKITLLLVLSINIFASNNHRDITAKIKSVVRTNKTEFAAAGAVIGSFIVGGSTIFLVRYIFKRCNKHQANQDQKDQTDTTDVHNELNDDQSISDTNSQALPDENSEQNDEQVDSDNDNNISSDAINTSHEAPKIQPPVWQINQNLTEKAPENFKGHWKVLELEQEGEKSFCIEIFEMSNTDKRNIKQKEVEKVTNVIFAECGKLIAQNVKKDTQQSLTIFLKYYTGSDDGKKRNCTWQKDKPWKIEL